MSPALLESETWNVHSAYFGCSRSVTVMVLPSTEVVILLCHE